MLKIMFVCLGNICRSPLAQGVMAVKIKEAGLEEKILVDSSGTGNWHVGHGSDPRMIAEGQKHNIPMTHLAQQFEPMHEDFDYIFAMDRSNLENIRLILQKSLPEKVMLFRSFDEVSDGDGDEVPDPYFGGDAGFKLVYEIVDRNCDYILDFLKAKL